MLNRVLGLASILFAMGAAGSASTQETTPWYPPTTGEGDAVRSVYQSRFPCMDETARTLPQCERLKFALALYHDPSTGRPTRYVMVRVYVGNDDERVIDSGGWSIVSGTSTDDRAQVIQLDESAPADFRLFWIISDDVIFLLDRDRKPRVGDAGYGYAVNRTG